MTQESIYNPANYDAIPFKERLEFQVCLIQFMLGPNIAEKSKAERFPLEYEWANQYAKKVSELIDNPINTEVRELIFAHRYQTASELLSPLLQAVDNHQHPKIAA